MKSLSFIEYYAIFAGAICLLLALRCLLFYLWKQYIRVFFFRHLYFPFAIPRYSLLGPISRFRLVLEILLWSVIAFFSAFRAQTIAQLGQNVGTVAAVQSIPIFLSGLFTFTSSITGASLETLYQLHKSLGIVTLFASLVHALVSGTQSKNFSWSNRQWVSGITVSILRNSTSTNPPGEAGIALGLLPLVSLAKRYVWGLRIRLHHLLSLVAVTALWLHIMPSRNLVAEYYVGAAGILYIVAQILYILNFLLQNYRWAPVEVSVDRISEKGTGTDAESGTSSRSRFQTSLIVKFPGQVNVRAGQYVILYVPAVSGFRSYRLPISWWSQTPYTSFKFILEPQSQLAKSLKKRNLRARGYFTGPYGSCTEMSTYGSVLLVATGYGIVPQLAHIKQLIVSRDDGFSCTRQVHLIWQFETWGSFTSITYPSNANFSRRLYCRRRIPPDRASRGGQDDQIRSPVTDRASEDWGRKRTRKTSRDGVSEIHRGGSEA